MINAFSQMYDVQIFSLFYGLSFYYPDGYWEREEPSLLDSTPLTFYKAELVGVGQVWLKCSRHSTVLTEIW